MLADYFATNSDSDRFWITDDDGGPVGVAYCELEPMTGTTLLRYIEQTLMARGGRVLLVETSGLPEFDRVRSFYRKCGYDEEARIRDFYKAGDDKIVYRKALTAQA
jgi:hypothetical protein